METNCVAVIEPPAGNGTGGVAAGAGDGAGNWISMSEAAELMRGRGGRKLNVETVRRWANPKRGCRPLGNEGPVLLLQTARVNGYLVTTREWVLDFESERVRLGMRQGGVVPAGGDGAAASAGVSARTAAGAGAPTRRQHVAAHRRAVERLARDGIGGRARGEVN